MPSTNSDALRRGLAGETAPFWVAARTQSAGRGRSGRAWASAAGNLHASVFLRPQCERVTAPQLALVGGVALFDAVSAVAQPRALAGLRLKWPNDLLIGEAKAGGILVESTSDASGELVSVLGFGLNLVFHPGDCRATDLAIHSITTTPARVLDALAAAMGNWLHAWDRGREFAHVREAWLARAGHVGEALSVHVDGARLHGRYCGLADDGGLLLTEPDGTLRHITCGDVSLAGAPPTPAQNLEQA